jgi:hypothetical protein
MKFVGYTLALTFYPLPQERKWLLGGFGFADDCPANPVARIFKDTADDSPSPGGEGRGEGGRAFCRLSPFFNFFFRADVPGMDVTVLREQARSSVRLATA